MEINMSPCAFPFWMYSTHRGRRIKVKLLKCSFKGFALCNRNIMTVDSYSNVILLLNKNCSLRKMGMCSERCRISNMVCEMQKQIKQEPRFWMTGLAFSRNETLTHEWKQQIFVRLLAWRDGEKKPWLIQKTSDRIHILLQYLEGCWAQLPWLSCPLRSGSGQMADIAPPCQPPPPGCEMGL